MISAEQIRSDLLRYLTGDMPAEEHAAFEERLVTDQDVSDAAAVCEQHLIDECAAGTLPREEARAVQAWLAASPRRAQRFHMAQTLRRANHHGFRLQRRTAVLALAACLLLAAGWSLVRLEQAALGRRALPATVSSSNPALGSSGRTAPLADKPPAPTTLLLVAERMRGDSPIAHYKVSQKAPLHLEMILAGAATDGLYELVIASTNLPKPISLQRRNLVARRDSGQTVVEATLPTGALPPAAYVARVSSGDRVMVSRFVLEP